MSASFSKEVEADAGHGRVVRVALDARDRVLGQVVASARRLAVVGFAQDAIEEVSLGGREVRRDFRRRWLGSGLGRRRTGLRCRARRDAGRCDAAAVPRARRDSLRETARVRSARHRTPPGASVATNEAARMDLDIVDSDCVDRDYGRRQRSRRPRPRLDTRPNVQIRGGRTYRIGRMAPRARAQVPEGRRSARSARATRVGA